MDEISQDPKLSFGFPRGRWLDVAVVAALITAAALVVIAGRGGLRLPLPRPGPARRLRRCCHQPCGHRSGCRPAYPAT